VTSQDRFIKASHQKQETILEWEYGKIYDSLPILCKSNEIHHEIKKLQGLHTMIKFIRNTDTVRHGLGVKYGGFVRDCFLSHGMNLDFHDIDIKFCDEEELNFFVSELMSCYNVVVCEDTPKTLHTPNSFPKMICGHCNPSPKAIEIENKYGNTTTIKTIRMEDPKNELMILMDLTIDPSLLTDEHSTNQKDFDVNTLQLKRHNLECSIGESMIPLIKEHIYKKQFVVLASDGTYQLAHKPVSHENNSFGIHYTAYGCDYWHCICRHSPKGKKMQERIKKMQLRGWTMLNEPCTNPLCILCPDDLHTKYMEEMIAVDKEITKKKKKKQFEKFLKKIQREEERELQMQMHFTEKERAILNHDKMTRHCVKTTHTKPPSSKKTKAKNYRKATTTRKYVWVDKDDYNLAKEMKYLEEDQ
jgi:hypothetical protein